MKCTDIFLWEDNKLILPLSKFKWKRLTLTRTALRQSRWLFYVLLGTIYFFGFSPFSTNWLNFSRYLGLNLHTTCIKLKSSKSFLFLCIVCNKNNDNAVHATLLPTYLTIDSHLRFNFQILESHGIIPWIWPFCIMIDICRIMNLIYICFDQKEGVKGTMVKGQRSRKRWFSSLFPEIYKLFI